MVSRWVSHSLEVCTTLAASASFTGVAHVASASLVEAEWAASTSLIAAVYMASVSWSATA